MYMCIPKMSQWDYIIQSQNIITKYLMLNLIMKKGDAVGLDHNTYSVNTTIFGSSLEDNKDIGVDLDVYIVDIT